MTTSFGITLNRAAQTVYNSVGYRFTLSAADGLNMPNEIFRYTRKTSNYLTNTSADIFTGICSSEQLQSLPVGAPDPNDPQQEFRLDNIDLVVETKALADDTWDAIKQDVKTLITSLKQNDVLGSPEILRVGDS